MNKLRRFYNQNSRGIWLVAIIIALFFIFLQLIDYWTEEKNREKISNKNYNNTIQNEIKTQNNIKLESNKSVVTGENKQSSTLNTEIETIQNFLNSCSQGKLQEAYDMLTEECKEEMYNTLEEFINLYYKKIFTEQNMNFNIENWINSTYKVNIYGDILATGKESGGAALQDYITIEKKDKEYKLNINNYIGRRSIDKENIIDDVKIAVIDRNIYMDYETYNIKIENNTQEDILLDTKQNIKSMYIKDSKGGKYSAYSHELTTADLFVQSGHVRNLKIKYYSSFNSSKEIESLVFSDVVMDYNQNTQSINKNSIKELQISI